MADFNFSVFTGAQRTDADASDLVEMLQDALYAAAQTDRWAFSTKGLWCYVTPHGYVGPPQGWKLHLSATVSSAKTVLAQALPVLLESGSAFKFAATHAHVAQLNARTTPRGHSGKFITVYPQNDNEAVALAGKLHQATTGLAGPRILSDRPYAPDSLVHYRYGAFVEERRLSNDGLYTWVIFDPEGNPVEDRRVGQYVPPTWARCPFPEPVGTAVSGTNNDKGGVLVGDRFLVREAIRHVNKGGVYRAVDTETGADVIIKEARPTWLQTTPEKMYGTCCERKLERSRKLGLLALPLNYFCSSSRASTFSWPRTSCREYPFVSGCSTGYVTAGGAATFPEPWRWPTTW
jgi:hypothetical protein